MGTLTALGNLTKYTDVFSRVTVYGYNQVGQVTRTIKDYGYSNITNYNYYDKLKRLTKAINENNVYTEYRYDKADRQTKVSRELGGGTLDTLYQYDSLANLTKETDPRSKITLYYYDKANRQTKVIDANSIAATYEYDKNGNLTRTTQDPTPGLNIVTINYYDDINQLTKTTDPENANTIYVYDAVGRQTLVSRDANSKDTKYYYDKAGRLTRLTDARNKNTYYVYDDVGNRTKVTDANSVEITYLYSNTNRLTKTTVDPTGLNLQTAHEYDPVHRLTKLTDPESKITVSLYDNAGRRTKVSDDSGGLNIDTEYYYDKVNNLTKIVDENTHATAYAYDDLNRLTKETFADSEYKVYAYDNAGNLTGLTDQVGNVFAMAYDDTNRLLTKSITRAGGVNGTSKQVFIYDNIGRMTRAQDNNGDNADSTIAQLYDKVGRLTKETQTVGAKTSRTVESLYDSVGSRTKLTHPSTRTLTFSYDSVNNLTKIAEGATTYATYVYDNTNMMLTKTLGTSTAVTLDVSYDNAYRSTKYDWKKSGNTVVGFTYGYSNAGNKRYEEKLHDTDKSQLYLYDGVYRLTNFKEGTLNQGKTDIPSPTYYQDWDLDGLGNWTKFYDNSGTPENRTHNTVNELTARDATNLTYDDNGNLTDDGTFEYEYDALNRLIKVTRKSDSAVMGEYAYDALNRRMWREADENQDGIPDVDLMFFYSGNQVVEEYDYSADSLRRDYIYGNYIDEPIFGRSDNNDDNDFADSEEQFYYTYNNLYNVAVLLDTSGNIIESYAYQPYGKPTIYTGDGGDGDWFDGDETTGSLTGNYYLFTGRRYESESGLYYFRRRYDSPTLGRFGQRDPTGYVDGMNLYTYVSDNPVNFTDAMGLRKGKGHFEVLIDSRTGKPVEPRPLVSRDVIISIGAAGAKRQSSEGARISLLAPDTPGEVIVSFHSGTKGASEGAKIDWLPPGTPGEVIVCWHGEKREEGVRAIKKEEERKETLPGATSFIDCLLKGFEHYGLDIPWTAARGAAKLSLIGLCEIAPKTAIRAAGKFVGYLAIPLLAKEVTEVTIVYSRCAGNPNSYD